MKIEHVALLTNDLEKMRDFYETYFAAKSPTGDGYYEAGLQDPEGNQIEITV